MKDVLKKLENDEHYYGKFGKQYLSNSDISTLLTNPLALGQPSKQIPAFLVGGYFHTAILEPEKLKKFKIVESTTRNTKAYKEISGGEMCLLQHEVDKIDLMTEKVLANDMCRDLIRGINVEYERPGIAELEGEMWIVGVRRVQLLRKKLSRSYGVNGVPGSEYRCRASESLFGPVCSAMDISAATGSESITATRAI